MGKRGNMSVTEDKVLVHFNTNDISVYVLKDGTLKMLSKEQITLEGSSVTEVLLEQIDKFLDALEDRAGVVNNERIRLYATGIFQDFTHSNQTRLIIHIFVNYGLYFNIIQSELEQFYLEKSMSIFKSKNMMEGLIYQEFRNVVVCGSFQQHLKDIEKVIARLREKNIEILSPA